MQICLVPEVTDKTLTMETQTLEPEEELLVKINKL